MTEPPDPPGASGPVLASLGRRLGARAVDALLLGLIIGLVGAVLLGAAFSRVRTGARGEVTAGTGGLVAAYLGWAVLGLVASVLYEVGLVATRGATLGKRLLRVRVVREHDGAVPGWAPSTLRWLLPQAAGFLTCGLATVLVYASPLLDGTGRRQGWHDRVARTLVIAT